MLHVKDKNHTLLKVWNRFQPVNPAFMQIRLKQDTFKLFFGFAPPPLIQTKYSLLYVCFVVLSLCLISRYCTHSGLFRFSSTFFKSNNSHWSPRIKDIPPLWKEMLQWPLNTPCHVAGYNQKSLATDHAEPTCVATHHARPTSVATHHAKVTSKDNK